MSVGLGVSIFEMLSSLIVVIFGNYCHPVV